MAAFQHNDSKSITLSETELRLKNGSRILCESPVIHDHFMYGAGTLATVAPWSRTDETGAATPFAPQSGGVGGHVRCVTGTTTNNGQELSGNLLAWKPSVQAVNGPLVMEIRLGHEGTTAANGDLYVGFNDAVDETNSLPYVVSAASALTTHAPSDFAGFAYSSIATSGSLFVTGGNPYGIITTIADVDTVTAPNTTNRVIKAAITTFVKLRIEIDSSGHCKFFANDKWQATVASGVTAGTKYTPYVAVIAKASEAQTCDIDYLHVSGDLV